MDKNIKCRLPIKPGVIDSDGDMFTKECIEKMIQEQGKTTIINNPGLMELPPVPHSVSYKYIKKRLAGNGPEMIEEYKTWNEFINQIGDKSEVKKRGFFYVIDDADIASISPV